jgi:hypothetical protein
MDQTVFISNNNSATFHCQQCGKFKTVDVSRYAATDKKIIVKCACVCGHQFRCRLEKRRQYRKDVDLKGRFVLLGEDGPQDVGELTVVNVSATGLKLKMSVPPTFSTGAKLLVKFNLDDSKRTSLEKRVVVSNASGLFVGVSFLPNELGDPAVGFYLMS